MKLILFGGSFDPPHLGHLKIIEKCCEGFDKIILMPSAQSPLKLNTPKAKAKHRIIMLELLIQGLNQSIRIDDWELNQSESNYTFLTIQYLQKEYPNHLISLVVGADQLQQFHKWKYYKKIMSTVQIIGFNRSSYDVLPIEGMKLKWLEKFNMDISSTEIREQITIQKDYNGNNLTPAVWKYIQENNLYGYE